MDQKAFVERVRDHGGLVDGEAEKAIAAVLGILGELLTADETASLASQLPHPMAQWLRATRRPRLMGLDTLYARVGERLGMPVARSLEVTQTVCRALAEQLEPTVRERLIAHLGPVTGRLFDIPFEGVPSQRPVHMIAPPPAGEGHTLATGRPGSRHPLSEAHPDNTQANSVVRSDNPHADSKVSSAHGLTQEILHETLADGKPGPSRKISDTRD